MGGRRDPANALNVQTMLAKSLAISKRIHANDITCKKQVCSRISLAEYK
jgi:hypothetical protein